MNRYSVLLTIGIGLVLASPDEGRAEGCYECVYNECEAADPGHRGRDECEDRSKCNRGTCIDYCVMSGGACWGDEGPPVVFNLPGTGDVGFCRARAVGTVVPNGQALPSGGTRAGESASNGPRARS